jgi:hypothetical protein
VYIDEKVVSFLFSLFVGQVRAPPLFWAIGGRQVRARGRGAPGARPHPWRLQPYLPPKHFKWAYSYLINFIAWFDTYMYLNPRLLPHVSFFPFLEF